jgi:heme exporter protein D
MIADLGRHADTVLAAYGVSFALLAGLVAASLIRAARIRRELAELEATRGRSR